MHKQQRISRKVAEAAEVEENAQRIIEVFKDAIHPSQPIQTRLKGAEAWVKIAQEHAKFEVHEAATGELQRSREELIALLAEKMKTGPAAALVRKQLEEESVIEGTIVDDFNEDENAA